MPGSRRSYITGPRVQRSVLALASGLVACGPTPPPPPTADAHLADVEAWREWRYDDLDQPDNWLALTGLFWLREGENTFGGGEDNDLVFPGDGVPARLGVLSVVDSTVTAVLEEGAGVLASGEPIREIRMGKDAAGDSIVLEQGSLRWYVMARQERFAVRLMDAESRVRTEFEGIAHFPVTLDWRVMARWAPYDPVKTIQVPNVLGTVREQASAGALVFEVDGVAHSLDVHGDVGEARYFVVFADGTNGESTYDGGRYVWVDAPDHDGWVVLDFNTSYNPPCVFTDYATCPLPARQNRLSVAVTAGEKKYDAGLY